MANLDLLLKLVKTEDWIKNGADGIINVLPFTCIPGNIVNAISKRIREEYKIPWLNLAFFFSALFWYR